MIKSLIKIIFILAISNCSQNNQIYYSIDVSQECKIEVTSIFFNIIPCQSILLMPILCKHKVSVQGKYYSINRDDDQCYVSGFTYTNKSLPTTSKDREKLQYLGWSKAHDLTKKMVFEYSLQTTFIKPKFYLEGKPPEFNFDHDLPIAEPWLTAVEFNIESIRDLTYIGYSK